ncbi:Tom7 protein [Pichia kluyveri]|uniref:Tom7 protein n=1 Tax=Pichia kluyveri TaxID=36015 RepID=A0AAV5R6J1_PICKL|nr:Tom7 protein [Pichia kluyveri]
MNLLKIGLYYIIPLLLLSITMAGLNLSEESKERFSNLFSSAQTIVHYGWLPFVIYLGWSSTSNSNKPNLVSLLSPLPSA